MSLIIFLKIILSFYLFFFSYNASSFNCSSVKYSFSFTAKSLQSLKQTNRRKKLDDCLGFPDRLLKEILRFQTQGWLMGLGGASPHATPWRGHVRQGKRHQRRSQNAKVWGKPPRLSRLFLAPNPPPQTRSESWGNTLRNEN